MTIGEESTIRKSEEKYRKIIENAGEGIFVVQDGKLKFVNPAFARLSGSDERNLLEKPFEEFIDPRDRETVREHQMQKLRGEEVPPVHAVRILNRKDRDFTARLRTVFLEWEGKPATLNFLTDVTEQIESLNAHRISVEDALRRSEEQFRNLIESTLDLVFIVDRRGFFTYVNPRFETILGHSLRDLQGRPFTVIVAPEMVQPTVERFRKGISGKPTPAYMAELVHKDGHRIPVEFLVTTQYDPEGNPSGRFGVGRDISERMKTAQEMERSREELRALAKRLQEIREEERTKIARDLHDDLGQTLTALKMDIAWLSREIDRQKWNSRREVFSRRIDAMRNLVDGTMKTARRIMMSLRPGILDELGLLAAMEWQVNEFTERTGIPCRLETGEDDIRPDGERSTALFRIFQECLTNVSRHAGKVTQLVVRLYLRKDTIHLEVEDNGRGIRKEEVNGPVSLGILGMRERAALFRGSVAITGGPGGTRVTVRVPMA